MFRMKEVNMRPSSYSQEEAEKALEKNKRQAHKAEKSGCHAHGGI